jgi:hypothetical protein
MRKRIGGFLIGVVGAAGVAFSMGATAGSSFDPTGVPLEEPGPVACSTANYSVVAHTGTNGEFPIVQKCDPNDATQGLCSEYWYTVDSLTGETISHSLLAISADQDIYDVTANGSNPWVPTDLGDGDSQTGFLVYAQHEYPIRLNAKGNTIDARIYIKGVSSARISTMLVQGGKNNESCLIAGPGIPRSEWKPTTSEKNVNVLHGECDGTLHYNGQGDLVNITLSQASINNGCKTGKVPDGAKPAFGGEVIQDANVPDGISFGEHSTIMYLPSGWAICTASPCPGTTTYVYTY